METLINILGWVGAALLLLAYALVSSKRFDSGGWQYQSMNIVGGVLLALNSAYFGALPSVVVNVVWIVIGLVAIAQWLRSRGR